MKITIEHEINGLNLKAGETLTVWLNDGTNTPIQVELRVLPNGKPQIFLTRQNMHVINSFNEWTPMDHFLNQKSG